MVNIVMYIDKESMRKEAVTSENVSEVERVRRVLTLHVEALRECILELKNRLSPVLQEKTAPRALTEIQDKSNLCPISRELESETDSINGLIEVVTIILEDLRI